MRRRQNISRADADAELAQELKIVIRLVHLDLRAALANFPRLKKKNEYGLLNGPIR